MAIRHETRFYLLERDRFGCYTLSRKSDGAEAFFQGDDADLWDRNMDTIERCHADDERALNDSFDFLCSGYDHLPTRLIPPSTQAIVTKFLGPTNVRGWRVKATASAGSVTVNYDYSLNIEDNHRAAAYALRDKFGWNDPYYGKLHMGGLPERMGGYVFVFGDRE